ncbi:MAG: glycoside hydrolase family 65 [Planctomycetes bacterium RBG_13_62_9]|nr:MAG: glycoside hydrolase family 65 [Planctomycetes bacterium RBG_13_62_9]
MDRFALVTRHNVTLAKPDSLTPLSVGNGEFAFTADITGMQTFPEYHEQGTPLCTLSQWGWHSMPNPEGYKIADALEPYEVAGRKVPYASGRGRSGGYSPAANWLRANPHRLHLGRIGLRLTKDDGSAAAITDLADTSQTLDLWTGLLSSRFELEGRSVQVLTVCHPTRGLPAVRIESPLLGQGRLSVLLAFPYGSADWRTAADWQHPDRHTTQVRIAERQADFTRVLDADRYHVRVAWSAGGQIQARSQHEYEIRSEKGQPLEIVFAFAPAEIAEPLPDFDAVRAAAAEAWKRFWMSGGAIDFSVCTDPRAAELERRVVLSQYLTAIHGAGSRPPQETGLVYNSWYGKFHLEMHWWHAAHFALWGRPALLERSLSWYQSILPRARAAAELQGYRGVRWPKMTAPEGWDSPSEVGVFLIWQQPHPIYYAELCYRAHGDRQTLERYRQIVFETADFMASYPVWDEGGGRYVLGPALIPAQESYGSSRARNLNPTFELAYWHWALETAQQWRTRLGLEREPTWDRVIQRLSLPMVRDGMYTAIETPPYTVARDHPSMLAAYGFTPATPLIDPNIMKRTLDNVLRTWDWPSTWGWDYPVLAMTAARLGEPDKAVEALFLESPKNRYLANGHNYQSARLPVYLPGNGGLLAAVAMMAAGWDGAPDRPAPGFPNDGKWRVRWEGLRRMP